MRILFLLLSLLIFSACREDVVRVPSETEANRILLNLREEGIDAIKLLEAGSWVISVPNSSFTDALNILEKKRLYARYDKASQEKAESDIFASRGQKENQALEKISLELAATILMFPGVVDAKVHIFKRVEDNSEQSKCRDSASVLLIVSEISSIDQDQIKLLVSKGSGIDLESVAVIVKVMPWSKAKPMSSDIPSQVQATNLLTSSVLTRQSSFILCSLLLVLLFAISIYLARKRRIKSENQFERSIIRKVMGGRDEN